MALLASSLLAAGAASAKADQPLSTMNGFRLGDAGVLCTAQIRSADRRLTGVFDRAYVADLPRCRQRRRQPDRRAPRRSTLRPRKASSSRARSPALRQPAAKSKMSERSPASIAAMTPASSITNATTCPAARTNYLVEGLAGYDPALRLALASVVTDRMQQGVGPGRRRPRSATRLLSPGRRPAPSIRPQHGTEAYARNNGGRFAEVGRSSSKISPIARAMMPHRAPRRSPTRACSSRTSPISLPPSVFFRRRARLAEGQWRHPAPAPQLSRDQCSSTSMTPTAHSLH